MVLLPRGGLISMALPELARRSRRLHLGWALVPQLVPYVNKILSFLELAPPVSVEICVANCATTVPA